MHATVAPIRHPPGPERGPAAALHGPSTPCPPGGLCGWRLPMMFLLCGFGEGGGEVRGKRLEKLLVGRAHACTVAPAIPLDGDTLV